MFDYIILLHLSRQQYQQNGLPLEKVANHDPRNEAIEPLLSHVELLTI